jgi:ubiquitin-conjugating enzyme E2 S
LTKIFHPNVAENGEICVSTLKKDWKSDVTIAQLLLTIKCLLIVPNPESALNEEAGKLLLEHYEDYAKHAALMTTIHAMKHKIDFETKGERALTPVSQNVSQNTCTSGTKRPTDHNEPIKKTKDKKSIKRL